MVNIPVRKCRHAAKVCFLLVLVVCLLTLFEQWRGGKRSAVALFSASEDAEYERQILEDEERIIPGLGEGGDPAHLTGVAKKLGEESEKKLAMNVYLSDRMPYNRTLKDHRNPACARVVYDAELPSASVIIIFHNEPYSVVLRTLWSVLNSARRSQPWYLQANFKKNDGGTMRLGYKGQPPDSEFVYLKEIILVDDNSTLPELKGKLSYYVRTRMPPDMIRILRLPDRLGLTRARLAGSRWATGDVMVFLDCHCEGNRDWLRPLLQRIKQKRTAVLTPIIDMLEGKDFSYYSGGRKSQGLMLARMRGARAARGDVLVFLDAHCEASPDWLRPLLQRTNEKRDAVLTPLIDVIDQTTFSLEAAEQFQIGGFTFTGHFTWIDVPEWEQKRRGSDIAPTWSPTMAGGLFAINRAYYWELGAYDEQMGGWGGENLEMSFRIWQCGGTLETIPCSRVGHVFRAFHPYGLPASSDTHGINTARMAEVWMDEYAELFYIHRPDLRKNPIIGDVTHRKILREKLHCKPFQWYLDNIYKEKFVPVRDVTAYGRFRNPRSGQCLDTLQREAAGAALGAYPCHAQLVATQYFALAAGGELRDEDMCAELAHADDEYENYRVLMYKCRGGKQAARNQKWTYSNGRIQHAQTQLCLTSPLAAGSDVTARVCDDSPAQVWAIDYTQDNDFRRDSDSMSEEQHARLDKLRRHRLPALKASIQDRNTTHSRISRSLLSIDAPGNTTQRRSHRKKHKKRSHKKKNKNKFILRIERTVTPAPGQQQPLESATEHLEVDIRCPHRRLYPNNSFVRDLVSVLNMHDIKVINNGRVFERNRVSALPPVEKKETLVKELELIHPTAEQRPEPAEALRQLKHVPRKHKRPSPRGPPPPSPASPPAPPAAPGPAPPLSAVNPRGAQHKIIIEDFVEVPSTTEASKRYRLRKRTKHKLRVPLSPAPAVPPPAPAAPAPAPAAPRPPPVPQSARDALLALLGDKIDKATRAQAARPRLPARQIPQTDRQADPLDRAEGGASVAGGGGGGGSWREQPPPSGSDSEDAPMTLPSSAETNDGRVSQPLQPLRRVMVSAEDAREDGGTQMRSKKKSRIEVPDEEDRKPKSSESGERRTRGKPVKVTMRNNFTFNIGDEFFSWRSNNDDVADILGELAIPSNSSPPAPPIEAWVRPAAAPPRPAPPAAPRDDAHDAHEVRAVERNDVPTSESNEEMKVLTGRGILDEEESNSVSKSDSSGD